MVLKCGELKSWDRSPGEIVIYPQCDPCDHYKLPVMFHKQRYFPLNKVLKGRHRWNAPLPLPDVQDAHLLESAKCDRLFLPHIPRGYPSLLGLNGYMPLNSVRYTISLFSVLDKVYFSTSQAVKRERRLAISGLQDCGINIFFFKKRNSVILVWEIARSVCETKRIRLIKKVFWLKTGSGFANASAAHFFKYFLECPPGSYSHQSN